MTPEQQAAYEERREQIRAVTKKISDLSPEEREDMAREIGTILTCERRALSPFNCCMLAFQRPDATIVGGFRQWQQVGRKVKKGERGCYIWIPLGDRSTPGEAVPDERRFKLVAVFDVSQTEPLDAEDSDATLS